jgi:cobyrinic acid a,c-diamide synthase
MSGIVVAGTHSGCGKTTVTLGLLAALKKKGLTVQSFKAGPDFIDSGLHRLITGRPSRNLDLWMCGEDHVRNCYGKNSADADISLIEGVMGLYDGKLSTSTLATVLDLPVILVVDAYGMAESAGAIVKGFRDWGSGIGNETNTQHPIPGTCFAGVIFNRVASEKHFRRLKESIIDIPVLGYLPRDIDFAIPHRHLGLTTAEDNPLAEENIRKLADAVQEHIDVDWICRKVSADSQASPAAGIPSSRHKNQNKRLCKIAVAYDSAFCFYYEDNLDALREAGAEIVFFSPLANPALPDAADALYIGGGYPELHAAQLSGNASMLKAVHDWAAAERPLYAECGGLMYLSAGLHDFDANFFNMAGVFPFETEMRKGQARLGYREVSLKSDCILGAAGQTLRGHEFHYSVIRNHPHLPDNGLIYNLRDSFGNSLSGEGYSSGKTLASYVHIHFGSSPGVERNFINYIRNER